MVKVSKKLADVWVAVAGLVILATLLGACTKNMEPDQQEPAGFDLEIKLSLSDDTNADIPGQGVSTFVSGRSKTVRTSIDPIVTYGQDGSVSAIIPDCGTDEPLSGSLLNAPQTRAGQSDDEDKLNRILIMIFSLDGTLETIQEVNLNSTNLGSEQPKWETHNIITVKGIKEHEKGKRVYVIANWDAPADIASYDESMIKEAYTMVDRFEKIQNLSNGIIMSGMTEVMNLSSAVYSVNVLLIRQLAKVSIGGLNLDEARGNHPNIWWRDDLAQVSICHIPQKSYLMNIVNEYRNDNLYERIDSKYNDIGATDRRNTFYVNENVYTSVYDRTYFRLKLPYCYVDDPTNIIYDNYYVIPAISSRKVIQRNTAYKLNLKIYGQGSPIDDDDPDRPYRSPIRADLSVMPWIEGEDTNVGDKKYHLQLSGTRVEYSLDPDDPLTKTITIKTDVPYWEIQLNGTNVKIYPAPNESFDKTTVVNGRHTYVLGRDNQGGYTLTITRADLFVNDLEPRYWTLVAKNLKIPIVVANDNGFIPNSYLNKEFWIYYDAIPPTTDDPAGKPARDDKILAWDNQLSSRGVQLAKADNRLPSQEAGEIYAPGSVEYGYKLRDVRYQWSTKTEYLTPNLRRECGTGPANTAFLLSLPANDYPAVQKCLELSSDRKWYLPSANELAHIVHNQSLLGFSYAFDQRENDSGAWESCAFMLTSTPFTEDTANPNGRVFMISTINNNVVHSERGGPNGENPIRCVKNM